MDLKNTLGCLRPTVDAYVDLSIHVVSNRIESVEMRTRGGGRSGRERSVGE
jgi:hypothetical protein